MGIGLRSNFEACQQLMDEDLLGVRRLAVVRDEFEMHQVQLCLRALAYSAKMPAASCMMLAAFRLPPAACCLLLVAWRSRQSAQAE